LRRRSITAICAAWASRSSKLRHAPSKARIGGSGVQTRRWHPLRRPTGYGLATAASSAGWAGAGVIDRRGSGCDAPGDSCKQHWLWRPCVPGTLCDRFTHAIAWADARCVCSGVGATDRLPRPRPVRSLRCSQG
jgi:hypothetical protein